MYTWVIASVVLGILSLILFFIFFTKDNEIFRDKNKKRSYLYPNYALLLVCLAWFGQAIVLYLNIQQQLAG